MKRKLFRLVFLTLLMFSLTAAISACGSETNGRSANGGISTNGGTGGGSKISGGTESNTIDPTVPGWTQGDNSPVTLDWYVNYSWFTTQWGRNAVSEKITEETGVSLNLVSPTGTESEKLDSMLASGTLPDIITLGYSEPQISKMISQGLVYPLNELAEQYDPYWFETANQQRLDWYRQEDGNVYGYPNSSFSVSDYANSSRIYSNQTFLVRKDIYEAIGSPDMTAPEGFKAAVKKAAGAFPEIDGEPLIPIGSSEFSREGCNSFDNYLMNFLAVPYEENGEVYDRYTDPEYIRWLKTFRELGAEGYLHDGIFLDKRMQVEEKAAAGRYFCMIFQRTDIAAQQRMLYERDPNSVYIAVDGPRNAKGDAHRLPGVGISGWTLTMISKNCKDPARAIELMTYFMSEHGQRRIYLGVEGVTYDTVDGAPVTKPEVAQTLGENWNEYISLYGADNTYWMLQDNMMQLAWTPETEPPLAQPEQWTHPYVIYSTQYDFNPEANAAAGVIYHRIKEAWGEALPRLLLANSEEAFDEIFTGFVNDRWEYGFGLLEAEMTRQMKDAKDRLGLE